MAIQQNESVKIQMLTRYYIYWSTLSFVYIVNDSICDPLKNKQATAIKIEYM